MPVFNGAKTVGKAIDCLLRQTFSEFELIVSDNASTDTTMDLLSTYIQDRRVRVIGQERNFGAFRNFMTVLENSSGKYFMWAAADDLWAPQFVESCVHVLDSRSDVGLAMTGWHVVGSWTGPLLRGKDFPDWRPLQDPKIDRRITYFIELEKLSHKANFIYGLWRRELAQEAMDLFRGLPESLLYHGMDIAILSYALGRRPFAHIPQPLFFKMHKGFPVTVKTARILGALDAITHPRKFFRRKPQHVRSTELHRGLLRISLQALGFDGDHIEKMVLSANTKRSLGNENHIPARLDETRSA